MGVLSMDDKSKSSKITTIVALTFLGIFVVAVIVIFIVDISRTNKAGPESVYNTSLGITVKLGMAKSKVDRLLGEPAIEFEQYVYENDLQVEYKDGKAVSLMVLYPNDTWRTSEGLMVGSSAEALKAAYGNPTLGEAGSDMWYFYFTSNGSRAYETSKIKYGAAFHMAGDVIMDYYISDNFLD